MSDWKQAKLEDFVELITDYVANGSFASLKENVQIYKEPNYALMVKTADFVNDFTKSLTYTDKHGYDYLSKSKLFGGELLLSNIGSVGKVFRVPYFDRPMTLASNSIMIRCKEELHYKWLYYFFLSPIGNQMLNGITTGTTMKKFNKTGLRGLIVPVPADDEKKRIVARIEELFSELDNGVETLRKTKQQLAVYRQAVLKDAFGRAGENELPLKQIIEKPRYGTSKKCSYDVSEDSVPVYRIPNVNYLQGTISHDDLKYAIFSQDEFDALRLCSGDILIIRSNGSVSLVGRSAVVTEKDTHGLFAGYLMRLRIKSGVEILPQYLNLYLNTHYARYQIEQMAKSTSGVNNINSDEICRINLPVCDVELQKAIIQEVEARLSVCDSIEKTVDTALQQAEAMRQSILKQAFEGRL